MSAPADQARADSAVRWWQCFWGHSWTKWRTGTATAKALHPHPLTGAMGQDKEITVQARDCEVCGLAQTRYWK